jgi:hypothetical protein
MHISWTPSIRAGREESCSWLPATEYKAAPAKATKNIFRMSSVLPADEIQKWDIYTPAAGAISRKRRKKAETKRQSSP